MAIGHVDLRKGGVSASDRRRTTAAVSDRLGSLSALAGAALVNSGLWLTLISLAIGRPSGTISTIVGVAVWLGTFALLAILAGGDNARHEE
jgi:hypothetical protein